VDLFLLRAFLLMSFPDHSTCYANIKTLLFGMMHTLAICIALSGLVCVQLVTLMPLTHRGDLTSPGVALTCMLVVAAPSRATNEKVEERCNSSTEQEERQEGGTS